MLISFVIVGAGGKDFYLSRKPTSWWDEYLLGESSQNYGWNHSKRQWLVQFPVKLLGVASVVIMLLALASNFSSFLSEEIWVAPFILWIIGIAMGIAFIAALGLIPVGCLASQKAFLKRHAGEMISVESVGIAMLRRVCEECYGDDCYAVDLLFKAVLDAEDTVGIYLAKKELTLGVLNNADAEYCQSENDKAIIATLTESLYRAAQNLVNPILPYIDNELSRINDLKAKTIAATERARADEDAHAARVREEEVADWRKQAASALDNETSYTKI